MRRNRAHSPRRKAVDSLIDRIDCLQFIFWLDAGSAAFLLSLLPASTAVEGIIATKARMAKLWINIRSIFITTILQ
jgi:hypothetical protein